MLEHNNIRNDYFDAILYTYRTSMTTVCKCVVHTCTKKKQTILYMYIRITFRFILFLISHFILHADIPLIILYYNLHLTAVIYLNN